jgi:hypothetical protein
VEANSRNKGKFRSLAFPRRKSTLICGSVLSIHVSSFTTTPPRLEPDLQHTFTRPAMPEAGCPAHGLPGAGGCLGRVVKALKIAWLPSSWAWRPGLLINKRTPALSVWHPICSLLWPSLFRRYKLIGAGVNAQQFQLATRSFPMANQWFIARDRNKFGPYSSEQMKEMANAHQLLPSDMTLEEGTAKWVPASQIPAFFPATASAPPPEPPEWYFTNNGDQSGPVTWTHLRQLAASGQVQPTDMLWKAGMPSWVAAGTI